MRTPFTVAELAQVAQIEPAEIRAYREAGLLDPDADGVFDDLDLLRLRVILHQRAEGRTIEQVAEALLGGDRELRYAELLFGPIAERYTVEQVARRVGMDAERVRALRLAVGLPGVSLEAKDVEVLSAIRSLVAGGLDWDALLDAARVYGDTLRRLAETEVRIFQDYLTHVVGPATDTGAGALRFVDEMAEAFQSMLDVFVQHIHRQHLLRASTQTALSLLEAAEPSGSRGEQHATIVFVDLASFTPLAQVHGDEVAADVLERFDGLVRDTLGERRGSIVKQIGDAFMLTFPDTVEAARFGIAIAEAAAAEPRFPAVRVAIHAGRVLYRVGDFVGTTVNLAARVAEAAAAGDVLVTEPVAEAARAAGMDVFEAGEATFRGIDEPVSLYRLVAPLTVLERAKHDPVCGMAVSDEPAARIVHEGRSYVFCSIDCLRRFLDDPQRHAGAADA